jgi:hypothetical protein
MWIHIGPNGTVRSLPAERFTIYPPGNHPDGCPLIQDCYAVLVALPDRCTRWRGFERAWIGADLRIHVVIDERDETARAWETPAA